MAEDIHPARKQAVEDAIVALLRESYPNDDSLIVTDWIVTYNMRVIRGEKDMGAVGDFMSDHSSVATLLGLATGLFERSKRRLLGL